jgi:archaellum component FlaG (FlaF/FlaG flagellin family)
MPGARHARLIMTIVAVVVIAGMLAAMMASATTITPR